MLGLDYANNTAAQKDEESDNHTQQALRMASPRAYQVPGALHMLSALNITAAI